MKHPMIRSRRMRYGGMTVYLTVALITALVLLNAIFSALANYKSWYLCKTERGQRDPATRQPLEFPWPYLQYVQHSRTSDPA